MGLVKALLPLERLTMIRHARTSRHLETGIRLFIAVGILKCTECLGQLGLTGEYQHMIKSRAALE